MGLGFTFKKQVTSVPTNKPIQTELFKEEDESEKKTISRKPYTEHETPKVATMQEKETIVQVPYDIIDYEENKETEASKVLLSRYQKLAESYYRKNNIKEDSDAVEGSSSKYIIAMKEAAEKRKIALEEARLQRNRREAQSQDPNSKNDNEEVFVTSAYRQKLEELKSQGVNVDSRQGDTDDSTLPPRPSSKESFLRTVLKDNSSLIVSKRSSRSRSPKRE